MRSGHPSLCSKTAMKPGSGSSVNTVARIFFTWGKRRLFARGKSMSSLCLIPIGLLVKQGFFFPQTMLRLTRGELNPVWALNRN